MIAVHIPGYGELELAHLVLDFNGTLAVDGRLIPGVAQRIAALSKKMDIHIITADTHASAEDCASELECSLEVIDTTPHGGAEADAKNGFVLGLGADSVAYIGNGRNDCLAMQEARLGMAVVQAEGAAGCILANADIILPDIHTALDLLLKPSRLVATLRG